MRKLGDKTGPCKAMRGTYPPESHDPKIPNTCPCTLTPKAQNSQKTLYSVNCHVYLALCTGHMLIPAVTFSPQAPPSADLSGTARVSAPLGKVSEWIVLAFRCTVRFLPEAALL